MNMLDDPGQKSEIPTKRIKKNHGLGVIGLEQGLREMIYKICSGKMITKLISDGHNSLRGIDQPQSFLKLAILQQEFQEGRQIIARTGQCLGKVSD